MPKQTWIPEDDSKAGDFSDVASQNTYQAGNVTDAVEAEATAIAQGGEAIWTGALIDPSVPYEVQSGQTFVIGEFELDSQGVQYQVRN